MSGHSKWSTIKRKKEKTDQQRAKVFTKIGRELAVAVKQGGPDPNVNSKLKDCIAKAKANNYPSDNIDRIIKKAAGEGDSNNYEEIVYEGYGPNGVAVVVETLTDNRNRTAGDLRHYFDKSGGNMGQSGSVMFMFTRSGVILVAADSMDEDACLELSLDAGADDFNTVEEAYEIICGPNDLGKVSEALEKGGAKILSCEIEYIPSNTVSLDEDAALRMEKLIDSLEDNDDVQGVWHNWEE
mgnify:CR=1 FL=1